MANGVASPAAGLGYRPDIDGLRAIAVTLVLVFHAFPSALPGGFAGVDVFFIISGYLISSLILAEHRTGSYGIGRFYQRRIRRLFPALLLVFTASLLIGWFVLLPGEFRQLGKHIAGGAGFVSNLLLWSESGYFDATSESKPLLHLWSLGVEEQFYILWPLLLYGVIRARWHPFWLILICALASFACNLFEVRGDASGAFYLPFSRFWELMLGGALACLEKGEWADARWRNGLALAGVGLLATGAALLSNAKPFPGWWALLPTLGAAALIAAGPRAWVNRTILAHPLMVGIGLISYPLYLWHWPLLSFLHIERLGADSVGARALVLPASVLLAWLTYWILERPLRIRWTGWKPLAVLMVGCAAAGLAVFAPGGVPARMPKIAAYDAYFADYRYTQTHDLQRHDRQACNFYNIAEKSARRGIDPGCYTPHSAKVLFVWGDSHAQHLQYGLRKLLEPDVSVLQVGASGCPPALRAAARDPLGSCNPANRFALAQIAAIKPGVVLLAQQGDHEDNDYAGLIAHLHQLGVGAVVLLGPVPQWQEFLYKVVQRAYDGEPPIRATQYRDENIIRTDQLLHQRFGASRDVVFVSLIDRLCNGEGCLVYVDGDPLDGLTTYDYGHFTLRTSEYVARTVLAPLIRRLMP